MGSEKIILNVPYHSQHLDVEDEKWKPRACGIVCLKMVMDYYSRETPPIDDLIKEMEFINGFGDFGSEHEPLVMIARNYGFHAYRQEFKSLINDHINEKVKKSSHQDRLVEGGLDKIIRKLANNQPIIISAVKNFSETEKFHLVVLVGVEKEGEKIKGFYYHDPDALKRSEGMRKFVPVDIFKKYWRKMSIYISI